VFVVVAHALIPQLKLTFAKIQWQTIGKLSSFGLVTFWIGVAQRLRFQSDAMVIGIFMSMQAVNMFAIGSRLVIYSTQFVTNMTQVFTPVSSHFDALGNHEPLQKMLIQGNFFSSLIAFPVCAFLVLAGKSIIHVWVGDAYMESYTILFILAIPVSLFTAQSATIAVLYGTAKHATLAKVLLAEGIANVVLSVALLQRYGIEGVAMGTAIPLSFTTFLFLPLHICRQLDVRFSKYLLEAHVYPALLTIPFAVCVWALNQYWPAQNYLSLALQLCVSGVVYCAAAAAFSMLPVGSALRLVSLGRLKGSAA
jgi:O-antigen/teichoic acid export membrane protein